MNPVINDLYFEKVLKQHEKRIYFYLHRLGIIDFEQEFYQEALIALWLAHQSYDPNKGSKTKHLNFIIRSRLIDLLRKKKKYEHYLEVFIEHEKIHIDDGNRNCKNDTPIVNTHTSDFCINDSSLLEKIKQLLTEKQWKWVEYFVIAELTIKEIASLEEVSESAVKSWGKQVRKKLRNEQIKQMILEYIIN